MIATKKRITWKRRPIAVASTPAKFGVPALICGGLGIVTATAARAHGLLHYSITHLGSGLSFGVHFDSLGAAKSAAEAILERYPAMASDPADNTGAYPFETQAEMRRFVYSLPRR